MTARRVIERHGVENTLLVFCDTKTEDEDLYRFIDDAVKDIGAEYLVLQEGRDVWEVFFSDHFIGNSRAGNCTRNLKQIPFRKWLESNFKPNECVVYLGFDWTEPHRLEKAKPHWLPYTIEAPMCDEPYMDKHEMLRTLKDRGIEVPRLYKLGFSHNNCGGFCVKAGQGHFKNLLEKMPERYAYHEAKEQEFRDTFQKDVSILAKSVFSHVEAGEKVYKKIPFTLKELREQIEREPHQIDLFDIGGCGCFTEYDES